MKRYAIIGLSSLMSLLALRLGEGEERVPVSDILIPRIRPEVSTVHQKCPAAERGCVTCHQNALTSRWASDRLVPTMEACEACHPAARNASPVSELTPACATCHGPRKPGEKPVRGEYPRPNIRFSHNAHRHQATCARCHPGAAAGQPVTPRPDVVGMKECFECHRESACRTCHLTTADGRMYTDYGDERLTPPDWLRGPSHGVEWAGTHARAAGADSKYCASCHQDRFCRDCHTGKRRPRNIHPGDWLNNHGVTSRLDSPSCKGCHRKQSFCLGCHRRSGVAPDSPPGSRLQGGRHPYHQGMDTPVLMRRAKRDVTTCVSCHNERSCVSCHIRYNPHPANFTRKCRALAAKNRRTCAKCHTNNPARFCK